MDLVTKIVILATALVGLYKAATFGHEHSKSQSQNGHGDKKNSVFSAFFELVGVLLFMFAFPAFIWGFAWITSSIPKSISKTTAAVPAIRLEIKDSASEDDFILAVASNIPDEYRRSNMLEAIVKDKMKIGDYKFAARAASLITDEYRKSNQLENIAKHLMEQPQTRMTGMPGNAQKEVATQSRPASKSSR